ncbi:hypothetical protein [Plebeiibacterium sediminum]|uniref:Uncharacterized protein n=1 Tax=Plebeiibacterium sediminum TaxID=2992112 RepID=A0AAE3M4V0_9BACT|nr:hypothetical protein [Plebeiobacterium sediminum]MCW3786981.1 hypothetical protein [Plebeiobacterium sediminum]
MNNCPNCWGYQEYNGEIKAVTVETIYNRRMPSLQNDDYKSLSQQSTTQREK